MRLDMTTDFGVQIWTITITDEELIGINFMPGDDLLLKCVSDNSTISDKLLGLELIARRIEESLTPNIVDNKQNKRKQKLKENNLGTKAKEI